MNTHTVHTGDSLEVLKTLPAGSIEAVVTDPPYGLGDMSPAKVAECLQAWARGDTWTPTGKGFMGKQWDAWVPPPELWREVLRVLKPGGHALIFAGSRTQDIMSVSLRLAGFEVRDTLQWLYGSGFPKSLDVSKALDKMAGAEREVIGTKLGRPGYSLAADKGRGVACVAHGNSERECEVTAPATEPAQLWQGWGTALKPAYEPAILARKPLDGTVAQNTLAHGCGGLNLDACRVGEEGAEAVTRFPANVILDEDAAALLDAQTGTLRTGARAAKRYTSHEGTTYGEYKGGVERALPASEGGASRFFYTAKASRAEREAGLGHLPLKAPADLSGEETRADRPTNHPMRANHHPTVKPIALMRYLVKLVTPPHGTVLDPFTGSGSTGCAAALERVNFVGVELDPEYAEIARTRIKHWAQQGDEPQEPAPPAPEGTEPQEPAPPAPEDTEPQGSLF